MKTKKLTEKNLAAATRMRSHHSGNSVFVFRLKEDHDKDALLVADYVLSLEPKRTTKRKVK